MRFTRYIIAVLFVAAAVCVNFLLVRFIEPSSAPMLFAAVLLASWQGGWGPGLLATILATLADDYFFVAPLNSLDFNTAVEIRLVVFLAVSTLTSYLTSKRREALEERDQSLALEREARAAAENANATKDRFLAATSHELRTPLSAILMWSDVLTQQHLPDVSREGVEAIRRCAEAQKRLVDDLLDVARLHTGKLRLEPESMNLASAIEQAITAERPMATAKNIDLTLSLDHSEEVRVWADRARLHQVVMNLLGNAVKFTPEGGKINVNVAYVSPSPNATIRVTDNGHGIEPQDQAHIFDQFWQAGNSKKHPGDGLGLGLSIARDLVNLHGGRIRVESEGLNRGATFIVDLPLIPPSSTKREPIVQPPMALANINAH
jgi:signal transduction histidine kinase